MAVPHRSARPRFTLLICVLTAATLVSVDVRGAGGAPIDGLRSRAQDGLAPIQALGRQVTSPIAGVFDGVVHYRRLTQENERLRRQVDEARGAQIAATGAQQENADLKSILHLAFVPGMASVPARVVAGPASNFQRTLVINRGSSDGVVKGMPVVSGAGLVGRIEAVSRHQSTVLLVTDPSFSVGIRLSPGGAIAVGTGQGAGKPLVVGFVDPDAAVDAGGAVVTSGLDHSPYPAGIPVGRVRRAVVAPGALRKAVDVDPAVDAAALTFLKVLLVGTS